MFSKNKEQQEKIDNFKLSVWHFTKRGIYFDLADDIFSLPPKAKKEKTTREIMQERCGPEKSKQPEYVYVSIAEEETGTKFKFDGSEEKKRLVNFGIISHALQALRSRFIYYYSPSPKPPIPDSIFQDVFFTARIGGIKLADAFFQDENYNKFDEYLLISKVKKVVIGAHKYEPPFKLTI